MGVNKSIKCQQLPAIKCQQPLYPWEIPEEDCIFKNGFGIK